MSATHELLQKTKLFDAPPGEQLALPKTLNSSEGDGSHFMGWDMLHQDKRPVKGPGKRLSDYRGVVLLCFGGLPDVLVLNHQHRRSSEGLCDQHDRIMQQIQHHVIWLVHAL